MKDTDMDKIIIVVRCSPPRYDKNLPMGSKTILTLREQAVFRTSYPGSDIDGSSDYEHSGDEHPHGWKGNFNEFSVRNNYCLIN